MRCWTTGSPDMLAPRSRVGVDDDVEEHLGLPFDRYWGWTRWGLDEAGVGVLGPIEGLCSSPEVQRERDGVERIRGGATRLPDTSAPAMPCVVAFALHDGPCRGELVRDELLCLGETLVDGVGLRRQV